MGPRIGITADIQDAFFRLRQEYVSAVLRAGGAPVILLPLPFLAGRGEKERRSDLRRTAAGLDGLLLSGGADLMPGEYGEELSVPPDCITPVRRERVAYERALLLEMVGKKKPVLGICLGMQLINVAFGGTLFQDIPLAVPHALDHRRSPHRLHIADSLYGAGIAALCGGRTVMVNSSHHQAVKEIGKGLEVFARAEDGVVEGVYKKGYPFLVGVQWHPERSVGGDDPSEALWSAPPKCDTLSLAVFELFMKAAGKQ